MDNSIEQYLEMPYWVVDALPQQVPDDDNGQFFKIENYLIHNMNLAQRMARILIKLNCYEDFEVMRDGETTAFNPTPETLTEWVGECFTGPGRLLIVLPKARALLTLGDDTYMTVYNPDGRLLALLTALAQAEGLFVWQPQA